MARLAAAQTMEITNDTGRLCNADAPRENGPFFYSKSGKIAGRRAGVERQSSIAYQSKERPETEWGLGRGEIIEHVKGLGTPTLDHTNFINDDYFCGSATAAPSLHLWLHGPQNGWLDRSRKLCVTELPPLRLHIGWRKKTTRKPIKPTSSTVMVVSAQSEKRQK